MVIVSLYMQMLCLLFSLCTLLIYSEAQKIKMHFLTLKMITDFVGY